MSSRRIFSLVSLVLRFAALVTFVWIIEHQREELDKRSSQVQRCLAGFSGCADALQSCHDDLDGIRKALEE